MNEIQIQCLIAAAESRSFHAAAEKLYMTPPTFGRHISSLEDELGHPLFIRGKQLQLTPVGELMYHGLLEVEKKLQELRCEADRISKGVSGQLTLAILEGQSIDDRLRNILGYFRSVYPELRIQLMRCSFREMEEHLLSGKLDIGITLTDEICHHPSLDHTFFQVLRNFLLLPKEHPMAHKEDLCLSDLAQTPLLELDKGECHYISKRMIDCCVKAGFQPKRLLYSDLQSQLFSLEAGLGMMPLNENHVACHNPTLVARQIEGLPEVHFCFAWNRANPNPAIQLFLEHT